MALPRQPEKFRFTFRLNSLWTIWFSVLIVSIEVYLLMQTINDYLKYNAMSWPDQLKPTAELNLMIVFVVFALLSLPFFVIACVFKVGNFANDGVQLGKDPVKEIFRKKRLRGRIWRFWRNFCPIAQTVHILSAFLLLLPKPLLEARIIRAGQLSKDAIWWTDLTVMFPNDNLITSNSSKLPSGSNGGENYISLQYINYATALFMLMIRYPSIFWYTSRPFSCIFSFQMFMLVLQSLIAFSGFSIIVKAQVNRLLLPEVTFCLREEGTIVLFVISSLIIFLQNVAVFEYGYHHYVENRITFRHRLHPSFKRPSKKPGHTCQGYIPHTLAMSMMLIASMFKAAIVYDGGMIYRFYNNRLLLWYIALEVVYLLFWIILWFALTVKQDWDFKFKFPFWHEKTNVFTIQNTGFRDASDSNLNASEPENRRRSYDTFIDSNDVTSSQTSIVTAEVTAPSAPLQEPDVCAVKITGPNKEVSTAAKSSDGDTKTATIGSSRSSGPAPIKMPNVPPRTSSREQTELLRIKHRPSTPFGSRCSTPANSVPTTPVSSRPTTPIGSRAGTPGNSRPTTPKLKSRDHASNRSDRKKRNRVTFEDCVSRNGTYSDDTDEEPACDDEDMEPDSSNCSTSSQESKPDPRPVGILKKPNRPQSPDPADIANALEGIKNAAKQLKPTHIQQEGALQPQIRSKLKRSNSRSSDISHCSDASRDVVSPLPIKPVLKNLAPDGSLPRQFRSKNNQDDYADYYSLQDFPIGGSRGQPNYASSGKGYNSRSRLSGDLTPRSRTPIEGLKPRVVLPPRCNSAQGLYDSNQPDSGVELSDSSTVTPPYGAHSPQGPVVYLNNKEYYPPGREGSRNRDSATYSISSSQESSGDAANSRLCSQV